MLKMRCPFFIILILSMAIVNFGAKLNVIEKWDYVDFVWDTPQQKEEAINSGNYNPNACILFDVDKTKDGTIFVTSVRETGVPASLMTVSDLEGEGGPLLRPYPDWSWYTGNCSGITSVYRVDIKCNRLFVLDCGQIGDDQVCPPKLLIFDLSNDKLLKEVIIPSNFATNANGTGLLVTPKVLAKHCCENIENTATVFMADIQGYGLVIYNAINSQFCRIESEYMTPTNTNFTIQGESFSLDDGILGLTLVHEDRTTYLYYTDLAGNAMYKIDVCKLKCPLTESEANNLTQLAGTLSGQTAPIASKQCALFFSNIPQTSIMCANACHKFNNNSNTNVVAQNSKDLQFVSGLKVRGKELIGLSNRFQRFANNTQNLNETNFRIFTIDIKEISSETNCFASCKSPQGKYKEYHEHDICHCNTKFRKNCRPCYDGSYHNTPWYYGPKHGGPYSGGPYPGRPYPGGPYPGGPYPGGPYSGGPYSGGPYSGGPYPGRPYPGGPYPGGSYPGGPYSGGPYSGGPYPNGPYPNGPYSGGPYSGGPYPNGPYPNGPYLSRPKPGGSYPGGPYSCHDGSCYDRQCYDGSCCDESYYDGP